MSCHCVRSRNLKNEDAKTRKWVVKASKRRRKFKVPIQQEARWTPESLWRLDETFLCLNRTRGRCTEWTHCLFMKYLHLNSNYANKYEIFILLLVVKRLMCILGMTAISFFSAL